MKTYVAYYRVSTQKQGTSGLGLAAQEAMVHSFVNCTVCIINSFVEVESGKRNNRPELEKAIAYAKEHGATLVIAKLDRLSRNAAFIFTLKESGVDFVCADMPDANTLTIGIFAVMAQHERELISKRTKDALAALKAKGTRLGKESNFSTEGRLKGTMTRKMQAQENTANQQALEWALEYRAKGFTLQQTADKLNNSKFRTSTGKAFKAMSVKRLLDRHDQLQQQEANFKFKIQMEEQYGLHLKAVNNKIRIDEGMVYFEQATKHTEPWPFTSVLFQQAIDKGAVLEEKDGYYSLYADRSKTEQLSSGSSFITLLGVLADRHYRQNMQREHEASLHPDLNYISKGNPEKKQPVFILSKVL